MTQPNLAAFQAQDEGELIKQHLPLVKKIALHLQMKLPDSVQLDDLMQAGLIGLLQASKSYDASQGARFETYAGTRIRGAILDEVRGSDWTPRSTAKQMREVAAAIQRVQARLQRQPSELEIANELGIAIEDYHSLTRDMSTVKLLSTEELAEIAGENFATTASLEKQPEQVQHDRDMYNILVQSIDALPDKEKLVMSLYYDEEMNLKEIGAVLDVSESRVSQIHGQAVSRLRAHIEELKEQ